MSGKAVCSTSISLQKHYPHLPQACIYNNHGLCCAQSHKLTIVPKSHACHVTLQIVFVCGYIKFDTLLPFDNDCKDLK